MKLFHMTTNLTVILRDTVFVASLDKAQHIPRFLPFPLEVLAYHLTIQPLSSPCFNPLQYLVCQGGISLYPPFLPPSCAKFQHPLRPIIGVICTSPILKLFDYEPSEVSTTVR